MRGVTLEASGTVRLRELAEPLREPGEVLVRVLASGICGSDRRLLRLGQPTSSWGHEVLGVIDADAQGGGRSRVGERVILRTTRACERCRMCLSGRAGRCTSFRRFSFNGFAGRLSIPSELAVPVPRPASERFEDVLVEPLHVALDLAEGAALATGDRALVVGVGPIGLLVIHALRSQGVERITAVARRGATARRALAADFGAEVVIEEDLARASTPGSFDAAIVTAPYEHVAPIIPSISRGGRIVYNGFSSVQPALDMHTLHVNRVGLVPSFPHPQGDFARAFAHLDRHASALSRVISHRIPLGDAPRAFQLVGEGSPDVVKVVLVPGDEDR